jgi:hypothetical protein
VLVSKQWIRDGGHPGDWRDTQALVSVSPLLLSKRFKNIIEKYTCDSTTNKNYADSACASQEKRKEAIPIF